MSLVFEEYKVRKIINVHKHVDGPWFWGKYTAHPYIGCRSGCEFCYARGSRYLGKRDPETFDNLIKVKTNAVELLRKELPNLKKDIITVGDWQQPAEDRYQLSRQMLEVVNEHEFPLFVVERSPLLTRDLDILTEINQKTWVGIQYSMSNVDPVLKRAFEPRSPGIKRRLEAIEQLALAGISAGVALMPVLPIVGDDEKHLEDAVIATKDHGGKFLVGGGMTMDGYQAKRTITAARRFDLELERQWRELYKIKGDGKPNFGPPGEYNARLGLLIKELCAKHGILDRMPRYILPGPLTINKQIAERLFFTTYDLELEQAQEYRIWAYRKAAWTVDELPEKISDIYQRGGKAALQELPGIGARLSGQIAEWLDEME